MYAPDDQAAESRQDEEEEWTRGEQLTFLKCALYVSALMVVASSALIYLHVKTNVMLLPLSIVVLVFSVARYVPNIPII